MDDTTHMALASWSNFYLITGTAAAALTGLQFVVQTLLASEALRAVNRKDPEGGIAAFGSPTVVHFVLALLISALMCAPWPGYGQLHVILALLGASALVYSVIVLRRARRQRSYDPTGEDWLWHVILPVTAYATTLVAALFLGHGIEGSLFAIAAVTLLLVCVGIHNAWDTVTYLTISALRNEFSHDPSAPPQRDT